MVSRDDSSSKIYKIRVSCINARRNPKAESDLKNFDQDQGRSISRDVIGIVDASHAGNPLDAVGDRLSPFLRWRFVSSRRATTNRLDSEESRNRRPHEARFHHGVFFDTRCDDEGRRLSSSSANKKRAHVSSALRAIRMQISHRSITRCDQSRMLDPDRYKKIQYVAPPPSLSLSLFYERLAAR